MVIGQMPVLKISQMLNASAPPEKEMWRSPPKASDSLRASSIEHGKSERPDMAKHLGLKKLFVKDESYRFGLNAFKVLGGSYAIGRYIAQKTGKDISEVTYDYLTSDKLKEEFGQTTFYTATDGNHGRGIAWAANKLGQKCDIIMLPQ